MNRSSYASALIPQNDAEFKQWLATNAKRLSTLKGAEHAAAIQAAYNVVRQYAAANPQSVIGQDVLATIHKNAPAHRGFNAAPAA